MAGAVERLPNPSDNNTMILADLLTALNQIAPLANAEPWDNTGLLVGDPNQTIKKILLTIDYDQGVAIEARDLDCDCIIAYHPPLFSAIKQLTADGPDSLIHDAIRRGVAIYSPHTAWDAATGGTNDFLAESLRLTDVTSLRTIEPSSRYYKLVVFVPESHVDVVSNALFAAGAGHIGNYHSCSFRGPGIGTFFGQAGTNPAVGKSGILEKKPEIRLETIIPIAKTAQIIHSLVKSHPYEEPAYDLAPLVALPSTVGHGRVGNLRAPMEMPHLIDHIKSILNLTHLLISDNRFGPIQRIAICAGAGGELLNDAIAAKADLYLTGELRHHDALNASQAGMRVICMLHSNSERGSLTRLMARLRELLPQAPPMLLSEVDRDPFVIR